MIGGTPAVHDRWHMRAREGADEECASRWGQVPGDARSESSLAAVPCREPLRMAAAHLLTTRCRWGAEKSERGACHDESADSEHGRVQAEARERDSISLVTNSSALNLALTTPRAWMTASNASWASRRAATGDASTFDTRSATPTLKV